jgi:hypothetical protein
MIGSLFLLAKRLLHRGRCPPQIKREDPHALGVYLLAEAIRNRF